MGSERGNFASRLGIILATAGSAVGLGNIWRFPYMTGENGGAAFILVYFGCVLLLGIPGMVSEFIVGRHSQSNAARAYASISGRKGWGFIGLLGIVTSVIILGFYAVVAGWCLQYLGVSILGKLGGDANAVQTYFQTFSSDPVKPAFLGIVFIVITHFIRTAYDKVDALGSKREIIFNGYFYIIINLIVIDDITHKLHGVMPRFILLVLAGI